MSYRKLGKPTDQKTAMLKNLVSEFLWNGKLETTYCRAMEVRREAEKLITLAIKSYDDTVKVSKQVKDIKMVKGKDGKKEEVVSTKAVEFVNDGPRKLNARRKIMANTRDLQEQKKPKETKAAFRSRTDVINHPLVEKIFNELAPKYAARIKEKGQAGGYTRVIKLGFRRGDNAELCVLQLVD